MTCIYCGSTEATTRDHVPPRALMCKPLPSATMTVPCCESCNKGFSLDEEYFRLVVVGLLCHTSHADDIFDGPIARSMNRNPKLESELFGSLAADDEGVWLNIDYTRVFGIAGKIACGLEYSITGTPYPPFKDLEVSFREIAETPPPTDPQDFLYRQLAGAQRGWEFALFGSVLFTVTLA